MPEYKRRFIFLESFYRAASYMSDEQELEFYRAMGALAFDGKEPEFTDQLLLATWETVSHQLITGIKIAEGGSRGGASKGAPKGGSKGGSKQIKEKGNTNTNEKEKERNETLLSFYSQTRGVQ